MLYASLQLLHKCATYTYIYFLVLLTIVNTLPLSLSLSLFSLPLWCKIYFIWQGEVNRVKKREREWDNSHITKLVLMLTGRKCILAIMKVQKAFMTLEGKISFTIKGAFLDWKYKYFTNRLTVSLNSIIDAHIYRISLYANIYFHDQREWKAHKRIFLSTKNNVFR
jgi:hypothetical protein